MLKRLLTVTLALMFVVGLSVGLALATNWVEVTSTGDLNEVLVDQDDYIPCWARVNQLYILQDGVGNYARGFQEAWDDPMGINYGWISQTGRYNEARLLQKEGAGGNKTWITQTGRRNYALVEQIIWQDVSPVANNNATIVQTGWDNSATVYQDTH